jgi:hypothetical protein
MPFHWKEVRKLQNSSNQYSLIVLHNFLTCIQLHFLCDHLLLTLVSHTRLCPVLWNTSCCCFRKAHWFSFWPHILNYFATLLHCNNGMVGSVHSQSSFFKFCHLIYCRKLYSLVLCPLYAFITCDVQLKECSWFEVTWLVLQFFSSSHGIEFTFSFIYIHTMIRPHTYVRQWLHSLDSTEYVWCILPDDGKSHIYIYIYIYMCRLFL